MVCFSVAVLSKNGKVLVSRQFVDMSRIRIEGLLAAFPKLIGTGNKQHTFVETDKVRYVYQPVESLYFLMITNKQSNIIEDLETLRLLAKLVRAARRRRARARRLSRGLTRASRRAGAGVLPRH